MLAPNVVFAAVLVVNATVADAQPKKAAEPRTQPVPAAPDLSVFGQPLNEPLSMPECKKEVGKRGAETYSIGPGGSSICFKFRQRPEDFSIDNDPNGRATVTFNFDVRPKVMSTPYAQMELANGNVVAVSFVTGGMATQETVTAALVEKYGRPTMEVPMQLQNAMGATFNVKRLVWRFSNLTIDYAPIVGAPDEGVVLIETPAGKAKRLAAEKAKDEPRKRL